MDVRRILYNLSYYSYCYLKKMNQSYYSFPSSTVLNSKYAQIHNKYLMRKY